VIRSMLLAAVRMFGYDVSIVTPTAQVSQWTSNTWRAALQRRGAVPSRGDPAGV